MKGSQLRHLVMCATTVAAMTFMTGCEKPVIAAADAPAVAGGVEFKLGSYELRYLELTAGDETFEYPSPVLIIPVTITNNGDEPLQINQVSVQNDPQAPGGLYCGSSAVFTVGNPSQNLLQPTESTSFSVSLTYTGTEQTFCGIDETANQLQITSNDPDESPYTIALGGTVTYF